MSSQKFFFGFQTFKFRILSDINTDHIFEESIPKSKDEIKSEYQTSAFKGLNPFVKRVTA